MFGYVRPKIKEDSFNRNICILKTIDISTRAPINYIGVEDGHNINMESVTKAIFEPIILKKLVFH
jgi:hypothetical protein